jgi:hypothetical protein
MCGFVLHSLNLVPFPLPAAPLEILLQNNPLEFLTVFSVLVNGLAIIVQ